MQGNLDPITLFAPAEVIGSRACSEVLDRAAGRPGHIFNLGHGILPTTPLESVQLHDRRRASPERPLGRGQRRRPMPPSSWSRACDWPSCSRTAARRAWRMSTLPVAGSSRPREPTPRASERTCARYRGHRGGSPLVANTRAQAAALEAALNGPGAARTRLWPRHRRRARSRHASSWACAAARPSLDETLADRPRVRRRARVRGAHGLPSVRTWPPGATRDSVHAPAWTARAPDCGRVTWSRPGTCLRGYLDAVADARSSAALDRLRPGRSRGGPPCSSRAHSVPVSRRRGRRRVRGGPAATSAGVVERRRAVRAWRLAYQSRSTRPGVEWLGPDIDEVLREMRPPGHGGGGRAAGLRRRAPGDALRPRHRSGGRRADELGVSMERAATVRDSPALHRRPGRRRRGSSCHARAPGGGDPIEPRRRVRRWPSSAPASAGLTAAWEVQEEAARRVCRSR